MNMSRPLSLSASTCLLPYLLLALMGCQSAPFFADEAAEYNDKTLVIGGCENGIGRGFQVCRFVEGSPIESSLAVFVPLDPGESTSTIRIRHGDKLLTVEEKNSAMLNVDFKSIVGAEKWGLNHDGPIQILATIRSEGRNTIKLLGYVYLVILKPGYDPRPLSWPGPQINPITCVIRYSPDGFSQVKCRE